MIEIENNKENRKLIKDVCERNGYDVSDEDLQRFFQRKIYVKKYCHCSSVKPAEIGQGVTELQRLYLDEEYSLEIKGRYSFGISGDECSSLVEDNTFEV